MDDRDTLRWAREPETDDPSDDEFLAALLARRRDEFADLADLNDVA